MRLHIFCSLILCIICTLAELDYRKIITLGRQLKHMMQYNKKFKGADFIKKTNKYTGYMEEVLQKVDEFTNTGKQIFKALEKEKGPPHIHLKINEMSMSRLMNLTREQVLEVEKNIAKSRELWSIIQEVYANRTYEDETVAILVDDFELIDA